MAARTPRAHTEMRQRGRNDPTDLITVYDVTSARTQINFHDPIARALMEKVTCADMTRAAFLFLAARFFNAMRTTLLRIPARLRTTQEKALAVGGPTEPTHLL